MSVRTYDEAQRERWLSIWRRCLPIAALLLYVSTITGCKTVTFAELALRGAPTTIVLDSSSTHFSVQVLEEVKQAHSSATVAAWGRYVINRAGPNQDADSARELTFSEMRALGAPKLALIPIIAPDQRTLSGSSADGLALAQETVSLLQAISAGFGQHSSSNAVLVFLDVEGDRNPVSVSFLIGWCEGLRSAGGTDMAAIPGIYTNAGVSAKGVRIALAKANSSCKIGGAWLASYRPDNELPHSWRNLRQDRQGVLIPIPQDIPIYLWQYAAGRRTDWSLVDPSLMEEFVRYTLVVE
jgi:hypothetical protein